MMASGEAVPVTALQGVSTNQADDLKEKGINDVETLATTSVDNLVDILDVSLDEAERIIASAKDIVEARNKQVETIEPEQSNDEALLNEESINTADNAQETENAQEIIPEESVEAVNKNQNTEEVSKELEASQTAEETAEENTKDSAEGKE
jgi:predicted RecB family nuclease